MALLEEVPVAVEERQRRVEELPQLVLDRAGAGEQRHRVAIELGDRIVEQRPEDLILGSEVQVDRALGHIGAVGNLADGRAGQAVPHERAAGRVEDLPRRKSETTVALLVVGMCYDLAVH